MNSDSRHQCAPRLLSLPLSLSASFPLFLLLSAPVHVLTRWAFCAEVKDYSQKVQTELDRLRGKIDDSACEQKRQADVLSQVNETVQASGASLEAVRCCHVYLTLPLECSKPVDCYL